MNRILCWLATVIMFGAGVAFMGAKSEHPWDREEEEALRLAAGILDVESGVPLIAGVEKRMGSLFMIGQKPDAGLKYLVERVSIKSEYAAFRIAWYKGRIHVAFIYASGDVEKSVGFDIKLKNGLVDQCGGPTFRIQ